MRPCNRARREHNHFLLAPMCSVVIDCRRGRLRHQPASSVMFLRLDLRGKLLSVRQKVKQKCTICAHYRGKLRPACSPPGWLGQLPIICMGFSRARPRVDELSTEQPPPSKGKCQHSACNDVHRRHLPRGSKRMGEITRHITPMILFVSTFDPAFVVGANSMESKTQLSRK